MTRLLEVDGLYAGYGEAKVLHDVRISVDTGEIVAVIGSNGAGKTTLMRAISGLIEPSAGVIRFDGDAVERAPVHDRVARGLSMVPEGRLVFPDFDCEETLRIGAYSGRARAGWRDRAAEMMDLFPRLKERRSTRAGSLSGGEQQMLAIARGLMSRPSLLLLDEPSLGLAPGMAARIFELIGQIRDQGTTVLLVEQDVQSSLGIADRGYVLENGRVAGEGSPSDLLSSDQIRESYLGL